MYFIITVLTGEGGVTVILASPRFEHPHSQNHCNMGIPLAIWVRVRVTGDAHVTRVLGMGYSNHFNSGVAHSPL